MASEKRRSWTHTGGQFGKWLHRQGKSPFTVKNYLHDLEMFGRWHKECYGRIPNPGKIQSLDCHAYRAHLQVEKRQSPSTVNRRVAAMKSFAEFLHTNNFTSENVAAQVAYLATPKQVAPDVLTHAQVLQLFKSVDRTRRQGPRDYAIIQLFVQCGLRLQELTEIQLGDITIKPRSGKLTIPRGKGGVPREIPLNKTAREAITAYRAFRPKAEGSKRLFISQKNRPLAARSIQDIVKKYLHKIGAGNYSCHSLRHLFATTLYNEHKDIVLVKEALGHKRLGTTLRYSHKTQQEVQDALENTPLNIMK
jgi:integrase/recombinase XerD